MGSTFGHLFGSPPGGSLTGAAWGSSSTAARRGWRCPTRTSSATRPPPAGAEQADHAAPGSGPLSRSCSGVFEGLTLGTPIAMLVRNEDARPQSVRRFQGQVSAEPRRLHLRGQVRHPQLAGRRPRQRPRDDRPGGGGRGGAEVLREACGIEIVAWVQQVDRPRRHRGSGDSDARRRSEANIVRCPDAAAAERMIAAIDEARKDGDSLGGVVECVARGVPAGPGRAGVRQARGRPGQGADVAARGQGLRDRLRLRRHAA